MKKSEAKMLDVLKMEELIKGDRKNIRVSRSKRKRFSRKNMTLNNAW